MFTMMVVMAVLAALLVCLPWILLKTIAGVFSLVGSLIGAVFSVVGGVLSAVAGVLGVLILLPIALLALLFGALLPVLLPLALLAGLVWLIARAARAPQPAAVPALPAPQSR